MPSFLKRLATALFDKTPTEADLPPEEPAAKQAEPVDRDSVANRWFDNNRQRTGRDSIDSNPDTARWYRRPRYVVPGAATHRTSGSFGSGN